MEPCWAPSATGNTAVERDLRNIVTAAEVVDPVWRDDTNGVEHFIGTDSNNFHEADLLHHFQGVTKCVDFLSVNNKDSVCIADKPYGAVNATNTLYLRTPMDCTLNGNSCWKSHFLRGQVKCSDVY